MDDGGADWRDALVAVQADTLLLCWHRKGFRLFWRWKSIRQHPTAIAAGQGTFSVEFPREMGSG